MPAFKQETLDPTAALVNTHCHFPFFTYSPCCQNTTITGSYTHIPEQLKQPVTLVPTRGEVRAGVGTHPTSEPLSIDKKDIKSPDLVQGTLLWTSAGGLIIQGGSLTYKSSPNLFSFLTIQTTVCREEKNPTVMLRMGYCYILGN